MNSRLILNNTRKLDYNIINFINLKDKYNLNVKAINARVNLLNQINSTRRNLKLLIKSNQYKHL